MYISTHRLFIARRRVSRYYQQAINIHYLWVVHKGQKVIQQNCQSQVIINQFTQHNTVQCPTGTGSGVRGQRSGMLHPPTAQQ